MAMLSSVPCYASEMPEQYLVESLELEDEMNPRIEMWTGIDTASGYIPIPAGTYIPGASSYYVRLAQTTLNALGYNCGTADGIYGTNTQNAIRRFQSNNSLSVDGVIGKNTWIMLHTSVRNSGVSVPF